MTDERSALENRWYRFFIALHRVLVILDDWLCEEYGFSRRAKGKYLTV